MPRAATIRLTPRDREVFAWLADMKAIHEDDLAVLLGRLANREPLSKSSTRAMVDRWRRHELVEARKPLTDRPRVVSLLAAGAEAAGETGTWHDVALWTTMHTAEVARVRLLLEGLQGDRLVEWQSERRLRQSQPVRKGEKRPHLPDGVVVTTSGERWAVEVERTAKESVRLASIVRLLTTVYDRTIYATTSEAVAKAVQRTYDALTADTSSQRPVRTNPLQVWDYSTAVNS